MPQYAVGDIVLAHHPICSHFHYGSVLTNQKSVLIVKFFDSDLGVQKIPDYKVMSETSASHLEQNSQSNELETIVNDLDSFSSAFFLKLLES